VVERRVVTNDELVAAEKDSDNRDLLAAESLKYKGLLDEDQRESAARWALYRCLEYHRDDLGNKFTTSLYKFAHWELRRELRKERRRSGFGLVSRLDGDITDLPEVLTPPDVIRDQDGGCREDPGERESRERLEHVHECIALFLPRDVQTVIRSHFFDQRTVEEIGRLNGYSKETARQKLEFGLRRLREICGDELAD
jgi:RNA polymerase sigma factor (sigma-70 family)